MDPALPEHWRRPVHLGEASSVVTDRSNGGRRRARRDVAAHHGDDSSMLVSTSGTGAGQDLADPEEKRLKKMESDSADGNLRTNAQTDSGNASKVVDRNPTPPEPPKQDYIHVRARRGQATDSHSIAERARREKISERMKMLQDLVPGCNKVIGKASVLDEIINYIQALQRQVEVGAEPFHTALGLTLDPQTPREHAQGSTSEWLHMQIGNTYERVT
ncbi:hypothetical protein BRADI_1g54690v3 [Brachypodium distachyon]|uniref:BHLH domain-containing protein n=1 Tax=Brachypodium distachyon TaxID=15368 RepID=I1H2V1_BRADI|nr:hypothetical protein BRADI_1g54690v3 [Brachypodium distachyon]